MMRLACAAQHRQSARANSSHSPMAWRTGEIDPELPLKIGPLNEREAPESGLWLKA
jgi:hypothetical protein